MKDYITTVELWADEWEAMAIEANNEMPENANADKVAEAIIRSAAMLGAKLEQIKHEIRDVKRHNLLKPVGED